MTDSRMRASNWRPPARAALIGFVKLLELSPPIRDWFQQQALAAIDEHRAKLAETA